MSLMDVTTQSLHIPAPHPVQAAPAAPHPRVYPTDQDVADIRQLLRDTRRFGAWMNRLGWMGSASTGLVLALAIWSTAFHSFWCHPV